MKIATFLTMSLCGGSMFAMHAGDEAYITSIDAPKGQPVFIAVTLDPMEVSSMLGFGDIHEHKVLESRLVETNGGKQKLPTEIPLQLRGTATKLMVVVNDTVTYLEPTLTLGSKVELVVPEKGNPFLKSDQ